MRCIWTGQWVSWDLTGPAGASSVAVVRKSRAWEPGQLLVFMLVLLWGQIVFQCCNESAVFSRRIAGPGVDGGELREQLADLFHGEIAVHPAVENLVFLTDVLGKQVPVGRQVAGKRRPVTSLQGGEHLPDERPGLLMVGVHCLNDIKFLIETFEQEILLLRVMILVRERTDEVDAAGA